MKKSAVVGFVVGLIGCAVIAVAYFMASGFKEEQDAALRASQTKTVPSTAARPAPASPTRPERANVPQTRLNMRRSLANGGVYQSGAEVEVTLALAQMGADPVRALGVVENIPDGWTFLSVVAGEQPDIYPQTGQTEKLEFVWFNIPKFPASFTYRLRAPDTEAKVAKLSGEALFRTNGPELRSGLVSSPLMPGPAAGLSVGPPPSAVTAAPAAASEAPAEAKTATEAPAAAGAGLTMAHQAAGYTPGQSSTVEVLLNYGGAEPVTAMAVRETLPEGWTFGEVTGGARPAVTPKPGDSGAIDFVWINVPTWPAAFTYTVNVPDGETAQREVKGMAIYRTTGGELHSEPVVTKLDKAASP